jgi:hypothetical protein
MPNFNSETARKYRISIETILQEFGEAYKFKYRPNDVRISLKLTALCNNLSFDHFNPVLSYEDQLRFPERAKMSQLARIQDSAQKLVNAVDQEIELIKDEGASSCLSLFAGKPKERLADRLMKVVLPVVFPGANEPSTARAFGEASASPVLERLRSPSLLSTL